MQITVQHFEPKPFNWWIMIAIISWFITVIVIYLWLIIPDLEAGQEPDWDELVPIIIQIESSGNPNAISKAGCIGLMQINPIVLKEWNLYVDEEIRANKLFYWKEISDLFNVKDNIQVGTWYLKRIWFHYLPHYKLEEIKNKPLLLLIASYNWGIGNAVKWYKQGAKYERLPQETRKYYEKFQRLYRMRK